jgi:hypothetical protein
MLESGGVRKIPSVTKETGQCSDWSSFSSSEAVLSPKLNYS